jgi:hypothetical protein
MSRLMSVAFTEQAVVERRKTVTRRLGWWETKHGRRIVVPGDQLTLCRKVMGRKAGEPLVRLADVEIVGVRREPLWWLTDPDIPQLDPLTGRSWTTYGRAEMVREGFPGMAPADFIRTYFTDAQGIPADAEVTRIEWRYLDGYAHQEA